MREVELPFTGGEIRNPLCSERAFKYWKMWANNAPLWTPAMVECAKIAWDRGVLYGSSMSIEQYTKVEKNYKSDIHDTHSFTTTLIHNRMKQAMEEGRVVAHNYRSFPSKRDAREKRKNEKKLRDSRIEEAGNMVDAEEEEGLQWGAKGKGIKTTLMNQRNKLILACSAAGKRGVFGDKDPVNREVWRDAIAELSLTLTPPDEFMKKSAFYAFLNGRRINRLKSKDARAIEAFCRLHSSERDNE